MIPKRIFFTKGKGLGKDYLSSFEAALRSAKVADFNLVQVSSILPPGCKRISKEKGLKLLKPGEIVFCVLSKNSTNEPNRLITASIGCAIPADSSQYGYLSEYHSFGQTEKKAGEYAENLAASMLAKTLGIKFSSQTTWKERTQLYKMDRRIIKTINVTQSAIGNKDRLWTTIVALAVFILK